MSIDVIISDVGEEFISKYDSANPSMEIAQLNAEILFLDKHLKESEEKLNKLKEHKDSYNEENLEKVTLNEKLFEDLQKKTDADIEERKAKIKLLEEKGIDKENATIFIIGGLDGYIAMKCQEKWNKAYGIDAILRGEKDRKEIGYTELSGFLFECIRYGLKDVKGKQLMMDGKPVPFKLTKIETKIGDTWMKYEVVSNEYLRLFSKELVLELGYVIWDKSTLNEAEKKISKLLL